eukprot:444601-Pyramimonas_sp.AAC.2
MHCFGSTHNLKLALASQSIAINLHNTKHREQQTSVSADVDASFQFLKERYSTCIYPAIGEGS